MKVRDLVAALQGQDPDAEAVVVVEWKYDKYVQELDLHVDEVSTAMGMHCRQVVLGRPRLDELAVELGTRVLPFGAC